LFRKVKGIDEHNVCLGVKNGVPGLYYGRRIKNEYEKGIEKYI
jgi:hypothetical protein